jgi:hypothetical protein
MLPDLGLSGLLRQAKEEGKPAPVATAPEAGEASNSTEAPQAPRKRRSPRPKPVVDRSEASPRTVWLSPSTWDRVKILAIKKRVSASEIVELALVAGLPDLVISERAA